jgi:hypothetical protein
MEQIALQETSARRWFDLSFSSVVDPGRSAQADERRTSEQYAETLAQSQPLGRRRTRSRPLTRTRERPVLRHYESIAHHLEPAQRPPAADRFVDNYYVVERQYS